MPVEFTTEQYDAQADLATNTYEANLPALIGGKMRVAVVTYTTTTGTDEVATDTILLCKLPVGSIPLPANSYVVNEDPTSGSSFIMDIGTAENPDGWCDGLDIAAAGIHPFLFSTVTPAFALTPTATESENIYVTLDTVDTTVTASRKIVFYLAYLLPGGNIPANIS